MERGILPSSSGKREIICLYDSSIDDDNDGNDENESLSVKNTNWEKSDNYDDDNQKGNKDIEIDDDNVESLSYDGSSQSTVTKNGISNSMLQPFESKTKSNAKAIKPLSSSGEVEILSLSDDEIYEDKNLSGDFDAKGIICENSSSVIQNDHQHSRSIDTQKKQKKRAMLSTCGSMKGQERLSLKKIKNENKNEINMSFSDSDNEFLDSNFSLFTKKKSKSRCQNNQINSTNILKKQSNTTTTNDAMQSKTDNVENEYSLKTPSIKVKSNVSETNVICIDDSISIESINDILTPQNLKPKQDIQNDSKLKLDLTPQNYKKYDDTAKKTFCKNQPTEILILSSSDEESNLKDDLIFLNQTPKCIGMIDKKSVEKFKDNTTLNEKDSCIRASACQLHPSQKYQNLHHTNNKIRSPESIDPNTITFTELKSPFATTPESSNKSTNKDSSNVTNLFNDLSRHPEKIPTPQLPTLYQVGGKLYPELRHQFIQALYSHALRNRHAAHQRCTFEATIRAIIILSIRETPIRTPYVLGRMRGIGSELLKVVQEAEKQGRKGTPYIPPRGKFSSVAPAALVALLENEKELEQQGIDKNDRHCCSAENLLKKIQPLVDFRKRRGFCQPISYYLDKDTLDPDWAQVS